MTKSKISSLLQDIEERLEEGGAVDESNLALFLEEMGRSWSVSSPRVTPTVQKEG